MILDINRLKRNGIFLVKCVHRHKGIVIATKNIITYLLQTTQAIDLKTRNIDKEFIEDFNRGSLELIHLEDNGFKDSLSLNLRLTYWIRKLQKEGMQFYNHQKKGTNYEIVIKLIEKDNNIKVRVMLKPGHTNSTKKFFTIGIFDTLIEAENWISENYKNKKEVYHIVYASNDLTTDHFSK